jgi:hypothetical protein
VSGGGQDATDAFLAFQRRRDRHPDGIARPWAVASAAVWGKKPPVPPLKGQKDCPVSCPPSPPERRKPWAGMVGWRRRWPPCSSPDGRAAVRERWASSSAACSAAVVVRAGRACREQSRLEGQPAYTTS